MESYIGLRRADYSFAENVAQSLRGLEEIDSNFALAFGLEFAGMLGKAKRKKDEISSREALFVIGPEDFVDRPRPRGGARNRSARLHHTNGYSGKVVGLLSSAPREMTEPFLVLPALAEVYLGRKAEAAALLEACLELTSEDYRDGDRLCKKFRERTLEHAPEFNLYPAMILLSLLMLLHREADGVILLCLDLSLDLVPDAHAQAVIQRLQQRARDALPDTCDFYLLTAAFVMVGAEYPRAGLAVWAADTELETLDWCDIPLLAIALRKRRAPIFFSVQCAYLSAFAKACQRQGGKIGPLYWSTPSCGSVASSGGKAPFMAYTFSVFAADWLFWWGQPLALGNLPSACKFPTHFARRARRNLAKVEKISFGLFPGCAVLLSKLVFTGPHKYSLRRYRHPAPQRAPLGSRDDSAPDP